MAKHRGPRARRRPSSARACRRGRGPSCGCPSRPAGRSPLAGEVLLERRDQRAVLVVDRAPAAEQEVVLARPRSRRSRGMPRPRVTFSRNGTTSSGFSGPPKETSRRASYGFTSGCPQDSCSQRRARLPCGSCSTPTAGCWHDPGALRVQQRRPRRPAADLDGRARHRAARRGAHRLLRRWPGRCPRSSCSANAAFAVLHGRWVDRLRPGARAAAGHRRCFGVGLALMMLGRRAGLARGMDATSSRRSPARRSPRSAPASAPAGPTCSTTRPSSRRRSPWRRCSTRSSSWSARCWSPCWRPAGTRSRAWPPRWSAASSAPSRSRRQRRTEPPAGRRHDRRRSAPAMPWRLVLPLALVCLPSAPLRRRRGHHGRVRRGAGPAGAVAGWLLAAWSLGQPRRRAGRPARSPGGAARRAGSGWGSRRWRSRWRR